MRAISCVLFALFSNVACSAPLWNDVCTQDDVKNLPFCDVRLSPDERAKDLSLRLSINEKQALIHDGAQPLQSLHLPGYRWWNEALHGVGMYDCPPNGNCPTSFPAPSAVAASMNNTLYFLIGQAIGTESRAYIDATSGGMGLGNIGSGLTQWSPTVNMQRDPRWGRNQEVPGEDPTLTAGYTVHLVKGMQGETVTDNGEHSAAKYALTAATCKHFIGNSLENWNGYTRHNFDAQISPQDLADYYAVAFKHCVMDGGALGIMCSYNSVNGQPMCANQELLVNTLRGQWNFSGYVTSDCGALSDVMTPEPLGHGYATNNITAAAAGLRAGTDLDCDTFDHNHVYSEHAALAVNRSVLPVAALNRAVENLVRVQLRLGLFDPKADQPFAHLSPSLVGSAAHTDLNREAALQSMVLLKNDPFVHKAATPRRVLPFKPGLRLAVIGPHYNATSALISNYAGPVCHLVNNNQSSSFDCILSPLAAFSNINNLAPGGKTFGALGCEVVQGEHDNVNEAVRVASEAEAVVLMMGLDGRQEGEGQDRYTTTLPGLQVPLIRAIAALRKPTALVLVHGGALSLGNITNLTNVAIVDANYPGVLGATAIADVLFGRYNPSGRLAATWYPPEYVSQVNLTDMSLSGEPGRTYMFYKHMPEFRFGHGLSYSSWAIHATDISESTGPHASGLSTAPARLPTSIDATNHRPLTFTVRISNTAGGPGRQTVLCFWRTSTILLHALPSSDSVKLPAKRLFSYAGVEVEAGGKRAVSCRLAPEQHLAMARADGTRVLYPGKYEIFATLGSATTAEESVEAGHNTRTRAEDNLERVDSSSGAGQSVAFFQTIEVRGQPKVVEAPLPIRPSSHEVYDEGRHSKAVDYSVSRATVYV